MNQKLCFFSHASEPRLVFEGDDMAYGRLSKLPCLVVVEVPLRRLLPASAFAL